MAREPGKIFARLGLRGLLVVLVLLTLCPVLGLALYNAVQEREDAARQAQEDALRVMRLLAGGPEQAADYAHRILAALSRDPAIRRLDARACDDLFADLLRDNPEYADILALTPDGAVFSSGSRRALDIRRLYSPLLVDRNPATELSWAGVLQGRSILFFCQPVRDEHNHLAALLAVTVDLAGYGRSFEQANLPQGSTFSIAKADGSLLYHSQGDETLTPRLLPPEQLALFLELVKRGDEANATGIDRDGVERLYSVKRLSLGKGADDVYVRIGIPSRAVFAEVDGRLWRNLLGIGTAGVLVLLLTWLYGHRFILNRVRALTEAAQRISQGDFSARGGLTGGGGEFALLGRSFDSMAESLERREEERQAHMAELRDKESRIQALFDATTDSVMLLTPDGIILAANQIAAKRRNAEAVDLTGTLIFDSLPVEAAELRRIKLMEAARTGQPRVFDEEVGDRVYRLRIFPVTDERGAVTHLASFSRDITQRRHAERELLKAKRQAEAANEAKTQFLANMSHELRTPLNGILGMLQLLRSSALDQEQVRSLEMARQCADSLHKIVNNLLEMASIEAGSAEILEREFGLDEVLDPLLRTYEIQARLKGLSLEVERGAGLPARLLGDPFRLRQVLNNLLSNALRFTPTGSVTLSVLPDAGPADGEGRSRLTFAVRDTGIGIPPQAQAHIFESFELAEHYLNKRYGGSGLGLSIARQVVERMGGEIRLESAEGQGSTFTVSVPFSLPGIGTPAQPRPAAPRKPRKNLRILLVEDELVNRMFASQVLGRMDHAVTAVTNGAEAIQALERENFDLILMDVQMPVMDGITATKAIRDGRTRCRDPRIPIIALTAYAMESDRDRFLRIGMDDFVAKPFTVEALAQAIDRALPG
ncbi:ATP-binding protein [Desulfovibrio aminophilus]|nr:ATP-binding protein [Desulfovibrio aminophilus]MCM0755979.1 ATP-binding protein [Desulfovibrio aminophilus]